jgi:hypothetical protein
VQAVIRHLLFKKARQTAADCGICITAARARTFAILKSLNRRGNRHKNNPAEAGLRTQEKNSAARRPDFSTEM